MNVDQSCGTEAFLITYCPDTVQALCLLSLKLTLSAYRQRWSVRRLDIFHFRKCFYQETMSKASDEQMQRMNERSSFASELFSRTFLYLVFKTFSTRAG
jgi:hypothetical protein